MNARERKKGRERERKGKRKEGKRKEGKRKERDGKEKRKAVKQCPEHWKPGIDQLHGID